jgi:protein-disulfide isomerase
MCYTCAPYVLSTFPNIVENYVKTGKVRVIFHNTLNYGEGSVRSAEAAACAARQGRFWTMHKVMFQRQNDLFGGWSYNEWLDVIDSMGKIAGLEINSLRTCQTSHTTQAMLKANDAAMRARGIYFQPIFEISIKGGAPKRIIGAPNYAGFVAAFEGR